jgi:hypothetical protein
MNETCAVYLKCDQDIGQGLAVRVVEVHGETLDRDDLLGRSQHCQRRC